MTNITNYETPRVSFFLFLRYFISPKSISFLGFLFSHCVLPPEWETKFHTHII